MIISYKKIIGLPVLIVKDGKEIGTVEEFIVDFDNGKLMGLVLSSGILVKDRIVRVEDVSEFGKDAIMIPHDQVIKSLKVVGILKDLLNKKIKIIGNKVITQSGEELGNVKDYEVDMASNKLVKLIVSSGILKDLFKGELIITANNIISIGQDAIVVRDNMVKEKKEEAVVSKVSNNEMAVDVLNKDAK